MTAPRNCDTYIYHIRSKLQLAMSIYIQVHKRNNKLESGSKKFNKCLYVPVE